MAAILRAKKEQNGGPEATESHALCQIAARGVLEARARMADNWCALVYDMCQTPQKEQTLNIPPPSLIWASRNTVHRAPGKGNATFTHQIAYFQNQRLPR